MPRVVKRSASQAITSGPSRRGVPLPQFVPPQLSQPVEKPPSGPQWLHEIKLDGYRMAARIDNGRVQLLTGTGLDWTAKYPSAIVALASMNVKTAYLDGELCGVDDRVEKDWSPGESRHVWMTPADQGLLSELRGRGCGHSNSLHRPKRESASLRRSSAFDANRGTQSLLRTPGPKFVSIRNSRTFRSHAPTVFLRTTQPPSM